MSLFVSLLYSPLLQRRINYIMDRLYSAMVVKHFAIVGKNTYIMRKIRILGGRNITIGDNFYCYWGLRIETYEEHNGYKFTPKIVIGNNVSINPDCHIGATNRIELHDGVLLASRVFITDHFHGQTNHEDLMIPPAKRILYSKGPVIIKENAWLGENVAVMPGITIGRNAVIGANSVVTRDIPDNAIAAGVPAKVIKQL